MVKEGTGFVSEKDDRFVQEGHYLNGMREGIWKFSGNNGIKSEQVYAAGLFVSGKTINPNGSTSTHLSPEALPEYKGGLKAFYSYLANNIKYPADAKQLRIDGTVFISLVVEANGSLTGIKVIKSVHPSLDQEALRVIRNSPKWIPGHQHGIPVKVAYTVPVAYKLRP